MKKIKKSVYILVYTVMALFLNTFSLFAEYDVNSKNSCDSYQECMVKTDAQGTTIHIESPLLESCIEMILRDRVYDGTERYFSDNFMFFCEKVLKKETEFAPEEMAQVLPELISYLSAKIGKTRAPRADAPGATDGSLVGPLLSCNNSNDQIIQLLNQLTMLFRQCCIITQIDFGGTFTVLATLIEDFGNTFTIVNDLVNTVTLNFNGTFTALEACCNQIFVDFNGVFTTLTNIENTIVTDFNGTFTVLNELTEDLTATFTVINSIKQTTVTDFNGTFTALAACCNQRFVDFNGVFTTLTDINTTLTNDFNGTFTALAACCNQRFVDFNGVFTTLADINSTLTLDFSGTFTALTALRASLCNATTPLPAPFLQSFIFITSPGYYCLSEDVPFAFLITTSNVTLDLNHHTLNGFIGISIASADNVKVMNGTIDSAEGVVVANCSNVKISNLLIKNTLVGVEVAQSISTLIEDVTITGTQGQFGVFLIGADDVQCKRVNVINFGGMVGIGTVSVFAPGLGVSNSLFEDCQIINSNSVSQIFEGFVVIEGNNNRFVRCAVKNVVMNVATFDPTNKFFGFVIDGDNSFLDNCLVDSVFTGSTVPAVAYGVGGNNVVLRNCIASNLQSNPSAGFAIEGPNVTLNHCFAENMSAPAALGFTISTDNINLLNCQANFFLEGVGFTVNPGANAVSMLNCRAQSSLVGFNIGQPGTVIGNCATNDCAGFGFISTSTSVAAYDCFAYFSVAADYTNIPNVQPASQNTLVFARGNNFIL